MTRDPRSEDEKARADLARNAEMGLSVPESPAEAMPSVTPRTFGDTTENGRVIRDDQGPAANETNRDIGDSTGTIATSRDIPVDPSHVPSPPTHRSSDEDDDVLSRAKE